MFRIIKQESDLILRQSSMISSGKALTLLLMQLITFMLDFTSIKDVFGTLNPFLNQELLELKPTPKWSSLIRLSAMVTLKILLKRQFPCVHLETSPIKLNIALNGVEISSTNSSMILLMMLPASLKSLKHSSSSLSKIQLFLV
jgi:hypothetical protein